MEEQRRRWSGQEGKEGRNEGGYIQKNQAGIPPGG